MRTPPLNNRSGTRGGRIGTEFPLRSSGPRLAAALLFSAIAPRAHAATVNSVASGPWSQTATWSGGTAPSSADVVNIQSGHTVTVDITTAAASTTTVNGTLAFSRLASSGLSLAGGNLSVRSGGTLDMGNASSPIPPGITAALVLAYGRAAGQYGLVVDNGGNFTVHGATKTPASTATADIDPGTGVTFSVADDPAAMGWNVGDEITVAKTNMSSVDETERKVITNIAGNNLTVDSPFSFFHASTSPIHVGDLTRNVLVRSSGTDISGNVAGISGNGGLSLSYGEFAFIGGSPLTANKGIVLGGAASISSCTIRDGYDGISNNSRSALSRNLVYHNARYGVSFFATDGSTLTANHFYSNSSTGIFLSGNAHVLRDNRIYGNAGGGILFFASNRDTLTGNGVCFNARDGIGNIGDSNQIANNLVCSNSGIGIDMDGDNNSLSSNTVISNGSDGVYVNTTGSLNSIRSNVVARNLGNGASGGGGNVFELNDISSNSKAGVTGIGGSVFISNDVSYNKGHGFDGTPATGDDATFVANSVHNNLGRGASLRSASGSLWIGNRIYANLGGGIHLENSNRNTFADDWLGYDPAGTQAADSFKEIYLNPATSNAAVLKHVLVNPAVGISTMGSSSYLLAYDQDDDTGTLRLHGAYTEPGSFALEHSKPIYASTHAAPVNMFGSFMHRARNIATSDADTLGEFVSVTHAGANDWEVQGSRSGRLGTLPCPGSSLCDFSHPKASFRLATGPLVSPGDRLGFATLAASPSSNRQKRLAFIQPAPAINPRLTVLGSLRLIGTPENPTILDRLDSSSTYYAIVSSGDFLALHSTFNNMNSSGLQMIGGSTAVYIASCTFDYAGYSGASSTATYITINTYFPPPPPEGGGEDGGFGGLSARTTPSGSPAWGPRGFQVQSSQGSPGQFPAFPGLVFNASRPSANLHNITLSTAAESFRWKMTQYGGPRGGETFEVDPNAQIDWEPFTPATVAPAFVMVGVSSIAARWDSNENGPQAYFNLQASTAGNFSGTLLSSSCYGSSASLPGLDANTSYFFRVDAVLGASSSAWRALGATSTLAGTVPAQQVYSIFSSSVVLNWLPLPSSPPSASSQSSEGYLAQVSTDQNFTAILASSSTPNVSLGTLSVPGLQINKTHYFRVGSLNWSGVPNFGGASLSTATRAAIPAVSSFSAVGQNGLDVAWNANGNPGYTPYELSLSSDAFSAYISTPIPTTSSFTGLGGSLSALTPNTTYYVRLRAQNIAGVLTDFSAVSSTITLAADPVALPFTNVTAVSLMANWQANENPAGTRYLIELSTSPAFAWITASSRTAGTQAPFGGLQTDITHYARVRAFNAAGTPSAVVSLGGVVTVPAGMVLTSPTHPPNTWRNTATVRFTASGPGVDHFHYRLSSSPTDSPVVADPSWSGSALDLAVANPALKYFNIVGHDGPDPGAELIGLVGYGPVLIDTQPVLPGALRAQFSPSDPTPIGQGAPTVVPNPHFFWDIPSSLSPVSGYSSSLSQDPTTAPDDIVDTTSASIDPTITVSGTYYFKVKAFNLAGSSSAVSSFVYVFAKINGTSSAPRKNAFNPNRGEAMTLNVNLAQGGRVRAALYTLDGQELQVLTDQALSAGIYNFPWRGRNRSGETVATGLYLLKVDAPGHNKTYKVMVIK